MSENIIAVNVPNIISIMIMVVVGGAVLNLALRAGRSVMMKRAEAEG